MNNTCIICDEIIPEGRQVCPVCEDALKHYKITGARTKIFKRFVARDHEPPFVQLTIDDMEKTDG